MVFTIVYASQLMLAGSVNSWGKAIWQETIYWSAWSLLSLLIFWLCGWLHNGARTWTRYTLGLLAGAAAVIVLHPLLFQTLRWTAMWLTWKLGWTNDAPFEFNSTLRRSTVNLMGAGVVFYAGTVLAWHAAAYYRDLKERHLKAVELESMLRQAQLQALRSQLNPHFLFNTLHSIAELVHENPPLAERVLLRLADLLRKVLQSTTNLEIPLRDELEFIKGYLEIEQMRLGERLRITWEIAPDTLAARVPSLILQPLVENAIRHGIATSTQTGELTIRASCVDGALLLQVSDNGPGLAPAAAASPRQGVGLANTRSRLQRLYGEQQRFELISSNGLTVNVSLPFATA
jgi:two-component system LytT family sensor kinase